MTVTALAKRLQDTHVGVGNANAIINHLGAFAPPVSVTAIEGETVVVALRDQAAEASGLKVGDVVLAVDDEPIEQRRARLEQFLRRLNAASHAIPGGAEHLAPRTSRPSRASSARTPYATSRSHAARRIAPWPSRLIAPRPRSMRCCPRVTAILILRACSTTTRTPRSMPSSTRRPSSSICAAIQRHGICDRAAVDQRR